MLAPALAPWSNDGVRLHIVQRMDSVRPRISLFERMRAVPPRVLLERLGVRVGKGLRRRATAAWAEARVRAGRAHLSDAAFCRAVDGNPGSVAAAVETLERRAGAPLVSDVDALRALMDECPATLAALRERAARALNGEFDLLGSGPTVLGVTPDWHADFRAGVRWPDRVHFTKTTIVRGDGSDIKVPWELSRLQHLPAVAYVAALDGDLRCVSLFERQVADWIQRNPPGFGVNWACTMDVAMRATSLAWAYSLFRRGPLRAAFREQFLRSMLEHGRHIAANLEVGPVMANHFLADVSGLCFLAQSFPAFAEAPRWREISTVALEREMRHQVYADGGDFEASTSYHRLVLELFLLPALLLRQNGHAFSSAFWARLRTMFEFEARIQKRTGRVPQVGDNDAGRGYCLVSREGLAHGYLNSVGAAIFEAPALLGTSPADAEAALLVGPQAFRSLLGKRGEVAGSVACPDFGLYMLRSPEVELHVYCGRNGQDDNGGHAHNDKLSFELTVGDRDVVVDPGTGAYTARPELRNRLRATAAHATVAPPGQEQAPLDALFTLADATTARCVRFAPSPTGGAFHGDARAPTWRHVRRIDVDGASVVIHDELDAEQEFVASFPLAPGVETNVDGAGVTLSVAGVQVHASFDAPEGSRLVRVEFAPFDYSPDYGVVQTGSVLRVTVSGTTLVTRFVASLVVP